jgi:hypothetical protein
MRVQDSTGATDRLSVLLIGWGTAALALQLVVIPVWLLPASTAWGWLLVPLALLTTPHWSLIHEAIHGTLLRSRWWNDHCGRSLAVGYGVPFALLKTGHLLHHRYSRTARERTEVYDPAVKTWTATLADRMDSPDTVSGIVLDRVGGRLLRKFRLDAAAVAPSMPLRCWRTAGTPGCSVPPSPPVPCSYPWPTTPTTTAPNWTRRWRR